MSDKTTFSAATGSNIQTHMNTNLILLSFTIEKKKTVFKSIRKYKLSELPYKDINNPFIYHHPSLLIRHSKTCPKLYWSEHLNP